tara:strand:+ start:1425 stop:2012 length:588 start_codon:yes stop_codon:yes gene_type:complete
MAFDLTNEKISSTFNHLLQVRDDDKTIYDAVGNVLEEFRLSGSFTTSEFFEIEDSTSVTGNKLHSRSGTLYWGNTNLQTGGGGVSDIVEDETPQLGGDLDINSKDVAGVGNFLINGSGSFTQMNIGATTNTFDAFFNLNPASTNQNIFLIQSGSFQSIKVNSSGVMNLGGFESTPTAVTGGFYYNSDENEFYLGV